MDCEKLKCILKETNVTIVPKDAMHVRGYDVEAYRALAEQTERIDYDCGFRDGVCRSLSAGGMGCCQHCAGTFGYWKKEGNTVDEDTLSKAAPFYDEQTGFLRADAGCILPRELRSPTCLYIFCSDAKMSGAERELLYRIQFGANWS